MTKLDSFNPDKFSKDLHYMIFRLNKLFVTFNIF